MRLIDVVPHQHYCNLDERRFTCDACGEVFADVLARLA
jgi:hypothetical protein